ncbi:MAG: hypothetical protein ACRDZ5_00980, partial [Acidimicrobiales bacterium]
MRTRRFGRTKVGRVFGGGAAVATAAILVATFTAIGTASASTASHHGHGPTHGHGHGHGISTCNNETLASGTYHNLRVRGTCTIPDGTSVTVEHNLVLEPNSQLKAVTASTVDVAGNILVRRGALLGLGCTLAMVKPVAGPPLCDNPSGGTVNPSNDVVGGNIVANHP